MTEHATPEPGDPNARIDGPKPEHPAAIITAADVIAEKAASEADGSEPNITPTHLGNPVAPPDPPGGPDAPLITAAHVSAGPPWRPGDTPEVTSVTSQSEPAKGEPAHDDDGEPV